MEKFILALVTSIISVSALAAPIALECSGALGYKTFVPRSNMYSADDIILKGSFTEEKTFKVSVSDNSMTAVGETFVADQSADISKGGRAHGFENDGLTFKGFSVSASYSNPEDRIWTSFEIDRLNGEFVYKLREETSGKSNHMTDTEKLHGKGVDMIMKFWGGCKKAKRVF